MNFINYINYIFSIILNPINNWKMGFNKDDYKRSSYVSLVIITFCFLVTIYFLHAFVIQKYTALSTKLLSVFCNISIDLIYFATLFITTKHLLLFHKLPRINNATVFNLLYTTLFPAIIVDLILKLFFSVSFLAVIIIWGFVILFFGLKHFFQIEKKIRTKIYTILLICIFGYYAILFTIMLLILS